MADGSTLGKAYVQIIPSAKGISGAIQGLINNDCIGAGEKGGAGFASKFASVAKDVLAGGAIAKVVSDSLNEGAKLQQSLGGIETLFKGSADKVKNFASEAFKTVGVSANEYMENVTSFSAGLISSLGGDTDKAANIANMAMIDMADNANKMGTSMESIQNAYQGFSRGNYTMLDNLKLGFAGTKSEMERLLAKAQEISGVHYDISNLSDVYEAIHVVQEEFKITGTTANEASTTLSGSLASMKASFTDLLGAISTGGNIGTALSNLGTTISTFLFSNLIPMIFNIVKSIPAGIIGFFTEFVPQFAQTAIDAITSWGQGFVEGLPQLQEKIGELWENAKTFITEKLPEWVEKGGEMLGNLIQGFAEKLPEWRDKIVELAKNGIDYLVENLPQWLEKGGEFIINLISGLVSKIPEFLSKLGEFLGKALAYIGQNLPQWLAKGVELLGKLIEGIVKMTPKILLTIGKLLLQLIGKLLEGLPKFLKAGADFIGKVIEGLMSMLGNLLTGAGDIANQAIDAIKGVFEGAFNIGKNLVEGIWNGISSMGKWIGDKIGGFFGGIIGLGKKILGIASPSKVFAEMGAYCGEGFGIGLSKSTSYVDKAMDELEASATRDLSNSIEYQADFTSKRFNAKSFAKEGKEKSPMMLNLTLAGKNFKAFVDDVSKVQDQKINLELAY